MMGPSSSWQFTVRKSSATAPRLFISFILHCSSCCFVSISSLILGFLAVDVLSFLEFLFLLFLSSLWFWSVCSIPGGAGYILPGDETRDF